MSFLAKNRKSYALTKKTSFLEFAYVVNLNNILQAAFVPISIHPKNYKSKLQAHKSCKNHYSSKKLLVKC
jgi:hypothetical protein